VENVAQAKTLAAEWPAVFDVLAEKFWPGPLTLIAKKKPNVSGLITSGLDTVALRAPDHALARELIRQTGSPLAAPSANKFGKTSPTMARHVTDEFGKAVGVVDGGTCRVGVESTVVAFNDGVIEILRPGGVTKEKIEDVLKKAGLKIKVERKESPIAPGHLPYHYQPDIPVIMLNEKSWSTAIAKEVEEKLGRKFASVQHLILPPSATEAARVLYQEFRRLGKNQNSLIVIERKPDQNRDEWDAIWDRVGRASTLKF
jgi:L-threonylcarbamoyladenylate synthase